jgi:mRNA-degrading endonuclease RelE of RelBE toxin-antitoxin system
MGKYLLRVHPKVSSQDLPSLPTELKELFSGAIQQQLITKPTTGNRFPNHLLSGDLLGYRALEIDWAGTTYRLVYRIYEKPAPRRVVIFSFDEHDSAYDKAKARTGRR